MFAAFLDSSLLIVALPSIPQPFTSISTAEISWILNAYTIVFGALPFQIKPVAGAYGRLARALFGQLQPRFWRHGRVLAEVTLSQQLERRFGLRSCKLRWPWPRILSGLPVIRNLFVVRRISTDKRVCGDRRDCSL
jgi:MFS family permease